MPYRVLPFIALHELDELFTLYNDNKIIKSHYIIIICV